MIDFRACQSTLSVHTCSESMLDVLKNMTISVLKPYLPTSIYEHISAKTLLYRIDSCKLPVRYLFSKNQRQNMNS